ncbi:MAG: molybdopterin molybdotransferase MoeA [Planctomycetota bacterium]
MSSVLPAMCPPHDAAAALCERVAVVGTEVVPLAAAAGRVLAERVAADRDSPAADVSAMDGYAVRVADWNGLAGGERRAVAFEVETGASPPALPEGAVARVFTGGVVPAGAEAVAKREDVVETPGFAAPRSSVESVTTGQHIRRRGENAAAGDTLLEPGSVLTAPAIAASASAGRAELTVHRRVRVAVLVTGNELDGPAVDEAIGEARVRDSNGPALAALLGGPAWIERVEVAHVGDDPAATRDAIARLVEGCDVLVTTGGVSMGDHDRVPGALLELGAEVVYHHLSMRPGKPNLGAYFPGEIRGAAAVCLPGNPVSVLAGGVVLAGPVLRRAAGWLGEVNRPAVEVVGSAKPIPLTRFLLARLDGAGRAVLLDHRGSGDVAAVGRSAGLVELPAGVDHEAAEHRGKRWPWWTWSVSP